MAGSAPTLIASVQRAMRLMEALSWHDRGAPAKRLAREAGLPLATTYHLLRTLGEEGYVRKLETGEFVLGDGLGALTDRSRGQLAISRVRPVLTALRDELSAACYLSFYEDGEIRVVDIADGRTTPRVDLWVGFAEAGHATALGKAVLWQLDDDDRRDYLARHPLVDLTPRTITHEARLLRHIEASGRVAVDDEEYLLGSACAAVPVVAAGRIGSLGISLPARQFRRRPGVGPRLVSAAERLARRFSI